VAAGVDVCALTEATVTKREKIAKVRGSFFILTKHVFGGF
jgi:hypothetical protein